MNPLPNEIADEWMRLVDHAKDLYERSIFIYQDREPPPILLDRMKRVRNTFDVYLMGRGE